MKNLMIALAFCSFGLGTIQAAPVQTELTIQQKPDKQKETISVDQLPKAAQEKIANEKMVVSQAYMIVSETGETWYKVKGTVDGEEKTMKFDKNGEVKTHKEGKYKKDGEMPRKQMKQ